MHLETIVIEQNFIWYIDTLRGGSRDSEQFNHQCFERSVKICEPLDIEAKKPRICGRQIMRDNVEAESPEDSFRKSITTFRTFVSWNNLCPIQMLYSLQ
jgi:hypothetical protein